MTKKILIYGVSPFIFILGLIFFNYALDKWYFDNGKIGYPKQNNCLRTLQISESYTKIETVYLLDKEIFVCFNEHNQIILTTCQDGVLYESDFIKLKSKDRGRRNE
jgi:hypothetical protein